MSSNLLFAFKFLLVDGWEVTSFSSICLDIILFDSDFLEHF